MSDNIPYSTGLYRTLREGTFENDVFSNTKTSYYQRHRPSPHDCYRHPWRTHKTRVYSNCFRTKWCSRHKFLISFSWSESLWWWIPVKPCNAGFICLNWRNFLKYPNNPVNPVYCEDNNRIHSSSPLIKFEVWNPHSKIKYNRVPFRKAKFPNRRLWHLARIVLEPNGVRDTNS